MVTENSLSNLMLCKPLSFTYKNTVMFLMKSSLTKQAKYIYCQWFSCTEYEYRERKTQQFTYSVNGNWWFQLIKKKNLTSGQLLIFSRLLNAIMKNVLMNKTCFSMNMYFKRDSVYGIKFYSCNKNPIKLVFVRPFTMRTHSILFYF